jgi:septal ring factor EnvC (AmiA/AmiB activator)
MRKAIVLISILIISLVASSIYIPQLHKEKDKNIDDINKIIELNNLISKEKQKEIDSINLVIKTNQAKIGYFESQLDEVKDENKDLRTELDKKKSQIEKMNSNELLNYWKDEFKN